MDCGHLQNCGPTANSGTVAMAVKLHVATKLPTGTTGDGTFITAHASAISNDDKYDKEAAEALFISCF